MSRAGFEPALLRTSSACLLPLGYRDVLGFDQLAVTEPAALVELAYRAGTGNRTLRTWYVKPLSPPGELSGMEPTLENLIQA